MFKYSSSESGSTSDQAGLEYVNCDFYETSLIKLYKVLGRGEDGDACYNFL